MNGKAYLWVQGAAHAVMRLCFFALVYGALRGKSAAVSLMMTVLAAGVLLFLLMPGRLLLSQAMRAGLEKKNAGPLSGIQWKQAMKTGFVRFCRGAVFGLPAAGLIGWFLVAYNTMRGNEFGRMIKQFSYVVFSAPTPDKGAFGFGLCVLALLLLSVFGWRRHLPMEYLPLKFSAAQAVEETKKVNKAGKKRLMKTAFGNAALAALCWAAFIGVIYSAVAPALSKAGDSLFTLLQTGMNLLYTPLSAGVLWALAGVGLLVHFPLWMLRRMRLCKAVYETEREMGA